MKYLYNISLSVSGKDIVERICDDIDDDRVIHALRISITRIESRSSYVSVTEDRPIHHC